MHSPCSWVPCWAGCSWLPSPCGWSLSLRGTSYPQQSLGRRSAAALADLHQQPSQGWVDRAPVRGQRSGPHGHQLLRCNWTTSKWNRTHLAIHWSQLCVFAVEAAEHKPLSTCKLYDKEWRLIHEAYITPLHAHTRMHMQCLYILWYLAQEELFKVTLAKKLQHYHHL